MQFGFFRSLDRGVVRYYLRYADGVFFLLIINGGSKVGTVHLLVSKSERDKQAEEKKLECGRVP